MRQRRDTGFWAVEIARWMMLFGTLAGALYAVYLKSWLFVGLSLLQVGLLCAPNLAEQLFHLRFSPAMKILLMWWIFGSIALGTVFDLYYRLDGWDLFMHGLCGVLLAAIGMALPEILDPHREEAPSMLLRIVTAVCFSLAMGFLWELGEYWFFRIFDRDVQHDVVLSSFATSYFTNKDAVSDVFTGITRMTLETDQGIFTVPGYLDIGFFDSLGDMTVHLIGTALFLLLSCFEKAARVFIPQKQ